jgi:Zn-dependent protease/CBS domain-containing protein
MGRSWRIGRVFGIDIHVHFTFILLLGWVALSRYLMRHEWGDAIYGLLSISTLFGIVALHELGHALAARRFGIGTRHITLLPIGGVARLERMPDKPRQELLVALAGPAVNVILAVILFGVLQLGGGPGTPGEVLLSGGRFLDQLLWANVFLAAFNLLPAFPMDGGRVLRALLAMRVDYVKATRTAASIGRVMAVAFGVLGLFGNPFLLLIAVFVWVAAAQEASMVRLRAALAGRPVGLAMNTEARALEPSDSLQDVVDSILVGHQHDFPVTEGRHLVGMLGRPDVLKALARHGPEARVGTVMRRKFETVGPLETLDVAFARLQQGQYTSLPVVDDGQLVGLITMDTLIETLLIQEALHEAGWRRHRAPSATERRGSGTIGRIEHEERVCR